MTAEVSYDLAVTEIDGVRGIVGGQVLNCSTMPWVRTEGIGELLLGLKLTRPGTHVYATEGRMRLPPQVAPGEVYHFEIAFDPALVGSGHFHLEVGLLQEGVRWLPQDRGTRFQIELVFVPPALPTVTAPPQVFGLDTEHPYRDRAPWAFWTTGVANRSMQPIDPVVSVPFTIGPAEVIATAGSCFAQNIASFLRRAGYNFHCAERHPDSTGSDFSALYGNIYTAHQLRQLLHRAYGLLRPKDVAWQRADGRLIDPFRPQIFPAGFPSEAAVRHERERHFRRVRQVFEESNVLIFTLGLTETWINGEDGTALPVPPGVVAERAGNGPYLFRNYGFEAITQELRDFLADVRLVNPGLRVILTVSPVPLIATGEDRHVLVSNTVSKSVLRAVADAVERSEEGVAYFPSYEIIAAHGSRGRWFADDLRSVTAEGVSHVMTVFERHYMGAGGQPAASVSYRQAPAPCPDRSPGRQQLAEIVCDEMLLEEGRRLMGGGIGIVSVCHGVGLANAARLLLPGRAVVELPIWHLGTAAQRLAAIETLAGMDRVFIAPLGPQYGSFAAERVTKSLPNAVLFPPLTFFGFHPDMTMMVSPYQQQFRVPSGDFHSKIVLAAYATGHTVDEAIQLFNPLILGRLGYFDTYAHEVATVSAHFRAYGFDLVPAFPVWRATGCFMHTPSHPAQVVLGSLMQIALQTTSIPFDTGARLHDAPDVLADYASMPVYPAIASRLGVPSTRDYQMPLAQGTQDRHVSIAAFVEACFEVYARAPVCAFTSAIGVRQAMEVLEH